MMMMMMMIVVVIMVMMMMTMTTMMMTTMMIMMMMMMITLKGAFRDFYNLLTSPRTVSNTYAEVVSAKSFPNHVQHIERVQYIMCHAERRDSSTIKFDRV